MSAEHIQLNELWRIKLNDPVQRMVQVRGETNGRYGPYITRAYCTRRFTVQRTIREENRSGVRLFRVALPRNIGMCGDVCFCDDYDRCATDCVAKLFLGHPNERMIRDAALKLNNDSLKL